MCDRHEGSVVINSEMMSTGRGSRVEGGCWWNVSAARRRVLRVLHAFPGCMAAVDCSEWNVEALDDARQERRAPKAGGEEFRRGGLGRRVPFPFGKALRAGKAAPCRACLEQRRGLKLAAQKFENNIQYVSDIPCVSSGASGGSGRDRICLRARKACPCARGQRHLPAFEGAFRPYV